MHEYERKIDPNSIDTDQKTYKLCKLKKRVDVLSTDAGQSGQHNKGYGVCDRSDSYTEERSNQHNMETLQLKDMSKEFNGTQKLYNTIEKDDKSCNLVLTNGDDETISMKRSNQHNVVGAAERFEAPFSFGHLADDNLIPMDFLYYDGLSFDELFEEPEATNNSNQIQGQCITNIEDVFLNSIFVDINEVCLQEKNTQQCLPAENEAFDWPCLGVIESSDSIEKPRKRPRLLHDGHVETTEAQVGNITYQQ